MIVLAYYNTSYFVTRYEVLQSAPTPLPANSAVIQMANVPDAFFESFDAYKVSGSTLVLNGTATKRITAVSNFSSAIQAKINALPWGRQRLAKTGIFSNL